ncbi:hypothetical protein ACH347_06775 [Saccharopolyspora sp. 5N102]|uniref:hypothetical protein n=1 Tax=Saccharopolyspora sp. 5N102 TaxID=3375155 RepID=UPI00379A9961
MNPPLGPRPSADGWRGVIGDEFTAANAATVAACILRVVRQAQSCDDLLIGFDGREQGEAAANAVAAAAQALGVRRNIVVPHLPTPTATHAVRTGAADAALLITASHNPPNWNGVKAKVAPGAPLTSEAERRVVELLSGPADPSPPPGDARATTTWKPAADLTDPHVAAAAALTREPARRRLRVVVDGLHGVAGTPMANLCTALGWQPIPVGCQPMPDFDGLIPDPSSPASRTRAAREVLASGADLGIVLDGDGDRMYVLDERGDSVLPHELFALLLEHRGADEPTGAARRVAITVATGTIVHRVAERLGYEIDEHPIGFKHLSPLLAQGLAAAACGGVGDLGFAEHGLDRDPFAAVAALADVLHRTRAPLSVLVDDVRTRNGALRWFETRVPGSAGPDRLRAIGVRALAEVLGARPQRITEVDGIKCWLGDGQWFLLRPSSTEGGTRLYGELADTPHVAAQLDKLTGMVRADIGAGPHRK